jgi:drug/metabolite transporter (DMT)-like permease
MDDPTVNQTEMIPKHPNLLVRKLHVDGMGKISQYITFLSLASTVILWGIAFPVGRIVATKELGPSPFTAAFIRFAFAIPFMYVLTKIIHKNEKIMLPRNKIKRVAGLGFLQISFYQWFFLSGMRFTSGSEAGLILNPSITLATALIASRVFADERVTLLRLTGIVIALGGLVIVFLLAPEQDVSNRLLGNSLIFGAALTYSIYAVFSRPVYDEIKPLIFQLWATIFGWLLIGVFAIIEQSYAPATSISIPTILGLAYLGVLAAAIGNTLFSVSIKNIGPTRSVVIINLVPLVGVVASSIILDEIFSFWYLLAFVVTFSGIYIANRTK